MPQSSHKRKKKKEKRKKTLPKIVRTNNQIQQSYKIQKSTKNNFIYILLYESFEKQFHFNFVNSPIYNGSKKNKMIRYSHELRDI